MIERDIANTIYAGIDAVAIDVGIAVQYPGRTFVPDSSDQWIEVVHTINNIPNEFWADGRTYQGLINLLFHFKNADIGVLNILDTIDTFAASIPKGTRWANVMIYDHPSLGSLVTNEGALFYPLTLKYRDFQTP